MLDRKNIEFIAVSFDLIGTIVFVLILIRHPVQLTQLINTNKVKEVIVFLKKLNEAIVLVKILKEVVVLLKKLKEAIALVETKYTRLVGKQTSLNKQTLQTHLLTQGTQTIQNGLVSFNIDPKCIK